MSAPSDIPLVYAKQLAVFEALRRIGIKSESIFIAHNHGNPATVVRAQGLQFAIDIEVPTRDPEREYIDGWFAVAERWNKGMTNDERMAIYRANMTGEQFFELVHRMREKGFYLPEVSKALGES